MLLTGSAILGGALYTRWRLGQIERVDLALAPAVSGADVWMLVGSDSRAGIDPDRPDAAALIGEPVYGERADSIILIRDMPEVGPQMLSLPRDLWFDPPGPDNATRINGAYNRGPDALVDLVRVQLGISVQHYVEIDLAGLDRVIEAVGGVTVELLHPGYDESLGLFFDESGPVELDGSTGLSFVRSRHWVDVVDGVAVPDGRGDLGRVERQQAFLSALGDQLLSARNPLVLNRVVGGLAGAIRVDADTGLRELYRFAGQLRAATSAAPLPVVDHITGGGAYVLLPAAGADEVLDLYR
ncbi:MAG: LCP family protein [Actinomycetota bacterium]|nr:LCP family protein [Actinomycetota bacterium]